MLFFIKEALRGKTLTRSFMNRALSTITLTGKVLDLGGGDNPSYLKFFKKKNDFSRITIDIDPSTKDKLELNLEHDRLPFNEGSIAFVLVLNLLEHLYKPIHALTEANRVLSKDGELIGFVPFLINVHPDPHDYFRYTDEALSKMLKESGFPESTVTSLGLGPFSVSYNTFVSVLPNILFIWMLPIVFALDHLLLLMRPKWRERFTLGYLFITKK